jgi:hypothetical protein
MSTAVNLANLASNVSESGTIPTTSLSGSVSLSDATKGIVNYANQAALPATANQGALAYVIDTKRLYVWNGSLWFLMFTAVGVNNAPLISVGPEIGYVLSTTGTPTVLTLAATDPEGSSISWTYAITSGSASPTATITQSNNVFTITPSTNTANGGSFEMTITASDGLNLVNAKTFFRLRFTTEDYGWGFTLKNTITNPPLMFNGTNAYMGYSVSANAGQVAIVGQSVLAGNASGTSRSVYIYSTLTTGNPALQATIDQPAGYTNFGTDFIKLVGNMVVVPAYSNGNLATWLVYCKVQSSWTLTQTITPTETTTSQNVFPFEISYSGLVMALTIPSNSTGSVNPQIYIYTRSSTADTTWTLRQSTTSIPSDNITGDVDSFPQCVSISASGTHIALGSAAGDTSVPSALTNAGKVVIFTNPTYSSQNYTWAISYNAAFNTIYGHTQAKEHLGLSNIYTNENIFYLYLNFGATIKNGVSCLKYNSVTTTFDKYDYDSFGINNALNNKFVNGGQSSPPHQFFAYPGPTGTNTVIFGFIAEDFTQVLVRNLTMVRMNLADISASGANVFPNGGVTNGTPAYWTSNIVIPNPASVVDMRPMISVDYQLGDLYVATPSNNVGGVTNSGAVFRFTPQTTATNAIAKEYVYTGIYSDGFGTANNITVPPGIFMFSAVMVGCGGNGGGYTSNNGKSSGGGGGLGYVTNWPVKPGDIIQVYVGPQAQINTASPYLQNRGQDSYLYVNGTPIMTVTPGFPGQAGSQAAGGAGGSFSHANLPAAGVQPVGFATGGANGGTGGAGNYSSNTNPSGGGGAAGYSGGGGQGQRMDSVGGQAPQSAIASGGGGGGGGSASNGGGVALYGIGNSGGAYGGTGSTNNYATGYTLNTYGGGGYGYYYASAGWGNFGQLGGCRVLLGNRFIYGASIGTTSPSVRGIGYQGT